MKIYVYILGEHDLRLRDQLSYYIAIYAVFMSALAYKYSLSHCSGIKLSDYMLSVSPCDGIRLQSRRVV